jgi:hypothetical protein
MAFYASQFNGTGTEADPFRPKAADATSQPWQAIDLRADATQQSGWCLVWTQETLAGPPAGVVLIATGPDTALSNPTVNQINSALGTNLPQGTTLRQAAKTIMTTEATGHGNGKWNPIVAGADGKLKLFLGDLVDEWEE